MSFVCNLQARSVSRQQHKRLETIMTDFHDAVFPLPLAFGARGGPHRKTDIVPLASGAEHRNSPHALSRRTYDAGAGLKTLADIQTLTAFFEARRGQHYSFRLRDPLDHQSGPAGNTLSAEDQEIGIGDGLQTAFQLTKTYGDSAGIYVRPITKPVAGTLMIAVNGEIVSAVVDPLTGIVTFADAPVHGAIISAGFQFDVQVRFAADHLDISLESFGAGKALSVPMVEVLDYA